MMQYQQLACCHHHHHPGSCRLGETGENGGEAVLIPSSPHFSFGFSLIAWSGWQIAYMDIASMGPRRLHGMRGIIQGDGSTDFLQLRVKPLHR
jgi:hypothetical protein